MKMDKRSFGIDLVLLLFFCTTYVYAEECQRPEDLKNREDYCWKSEVEIQDRIVQTSKSVLNFAKKKLGIAVEEENGVQKCEYYFCVLKQLRLVNAQDYPSYEGVKLWAERNVIYYQEVELMAQLDKCNQALIDSKVSETVFNGDLSRNLTDSRSGESQNTCQIGLEFMKCLSATSVECPVFTFP